MILLLVGVFKKNSTSLIYSLSVVTLIVTIGLIINYPSYQETFLFNNSYKIDQLSTLMKIVTILSWFDQDLLAKSIFKIEDS